METTGSIPSGRAQKTSKDFFGWLVLPFNKLPLVSGQKVPDNRGENALCNSRKPMAKSKGRKKIVFFSILILVIVAAVVYSKYTKRAQPVFITQEKVTRRNLTEEVVANGKIESVLEVKISPEVSGEIIELNVKEGQRVKKGDLLLKIRPDNYVAARDSANANYKFAVA